MHLAFFVNKTSFRNKTFLVLFFVLYKVMLSAFTLYRKNCNHEILFQPFLKVSKSIPCFCSTLAKFWFRSTVLAGKIYHRL